jgi:hypothetical protein
VLVTAPGSYYAPLTNFDLERASKDIETHLLLPILIAKTLAIRFGREALFFSWGAQEGGP